MLKMHIYQNSISSLVGKEAWRASEAKAKMYAEEYRKACSIAGSQSSGNGGVMAYANLSSFVE